jgi:hypothetical protein
MFLEAASRLRDIAIEADGERSRMNAPFGISDSLAELVGA